MKKRHLMDWDGLLQEYFFSKALRPETEKSYRRVVTVFRKFVGLNVLPDEVTHRDFCCGVEIY